MGHTVQNAVEKKANHKPSREAQQKDVFSVFHPLNHAKCLVLFFLPNQNIKEMESKGSRHHHYWADKFVVDGLVSMKQVLGLGISVSLAVAVHPVVGLLYFGRVLVEALIERR